MADMMRLNAVINLFFLFFFFINIYIAQSQLQQTLQGFCTFLFDVVGTLASVMIVLSSIAYTAGQFLGAELRARATVWSQSMLSGAVIGILLIIIVPYILGVLIGKTWDSATCTFT
ncbi:MAG: hypothetical protein QXI89_01915 [Candidatus Anstonellales archaeon]